MKQITTTERQEIKEKLFQFYAGKITMSDWLKYVGQLLMNFENVYSEIDKIRAEIDKDPKEVKTFALKTNGEAREATPKNGDKFTLEELSAFVGGYIEIVFLPENRLMILNEEGKLNGLDINIKATQICKIATAANGGVFNDFIVGDVLICNQTQID